MIFFSAAEDIFLTLCSDLGVPIASDKTVLLYSTHIFPFLGIEFNTQDVTMKLPEEKICEIRHKILDIKSRSSSSNPYWGV